MHLMGQNELKTSHTTLLQIISSGAQVYNMLSDSKEP